MIETVQTESDEDAAPEQQPVLYPVAQVTAVGDGVHGELCDQGDDHAGENGGERREKAARLRDGPFTSHPSGRRGPSILPVRSGHIGAIPRLRIRREVPPGR